MTRILLTIGLLIGSVGLAYGQLDPGDAYRLNQWQLNRNAKPLTPEQVEANRKAAEAKREAAAIVPDGQQLRVWHKGNLPKPTRGWAVKVDPSKIIQGRLVKIYSDTVVLELKDKTTEEIKRRELCKEDRALVEKIAARPKK